MKNFFFIGVLIMSSCNKTLVPPIANKEPYEMINHGHKRVDNYYWMRLTDEQKNQKILMSKPWKLSNILIKKTITRRKVFRIPKDFKRIYLMKLSKDFRKMTKQFHI